jgi:hypothetical protein
MSILVVSVMSARESATVSSERCVSASQGSEHKAFRRALPFQMLTKLSSMAVWSMLCVWMLVGGKVNDDQGVKYLSVMKSNQYNRLLH